jgi:ACS family pantothenate transporter-like MFS transporter
VPDIDQSKIIEMASERSPLLQTNDTTDRRIAPDNDGTLESPAKPSGSGGISLYNTIAKLWGPPSTERSLLIKLDFTLLLYFSIIWFLFGVNRASYSTAYISGMKEDLNFQVSSMFTKATLKSISDSYRRVKITIT